MHTLTDEQIGLAKRLSKCDDLPKLFSDENTEWKAIVVMQNSLDASDCSLYINNVWKRGYHLGNAPIEQRVEAFIETKVRR